MPRKRTDLGTGVGEPSAARANPAKGRHFTPEERRQAVEAFNASDLTQDAFSKTWGISAHSLASWRRVYAQRGPKGLERLTDEPPRRRGNAPLHEAKKKAILQAKREFPTFGFGKIRDFLKRFSALRVSKASVRRTLRGANMPPVDVRRKRRRVARPPKAPVRSRPGELWQTDITYLDVAWSKRPLYLVAFIDDVSRYVVSAGLHTHQRQDIVIEALTEAILRFGKPREVLSDQGRQYYAWRGKTDFQKLLHKEAIAHVVARAHHPQTVGRCERFWETLKREFWDRVRVKDLEDARARLKHFVAHYNHFRPHQSLDGLTPADCFFGAEKDVRAAIEVEMERNELLLALNEPPRKPLFFVGQIGDERFSLHGERGNVVVETPDGVRRAVSMDHLGVEARKEEDHGGEHGSSGGGDRAGASAPAAGAQAHEDPRAGQDASGGARSLEERHPRGPGEGAPGDDRAARDLAREEDAGGGGEGARDAASSLLAALADGGGGDGGGVPPAAAGEEGKAWAGPDASTGGGPDRARQEDPGARGGARGGEAADRDPAAASGAAAEPERGGTWREPREGDGRLDR